MRSKTWAIALVILSRLTVADCIGPPVHRPYPATAERVRERDRDIDDIYRIREELARQNLLKHLKLPPVQNGVSATEVEYADDDTEPRQRYYGNKLHQRPHTATYDKPPEMTSNYRHGPPSRTLQGPKQPQTHHGNHQRYHGTDKDQPEGGEIPSTEDNEADPSEQEVIRSAPYVHIRSGVDSFQPIAAAIAMQENLNALEDIPPSTAPPPPPPLPSEHVPFSAVKDEEEEEAGVEPEVPPHVDRPTGLTYSNKEFLVPGGSHGFEKGMTGNDMPEALHLKKEKEFSETASLTEVYFLAVVAGCSVAGFVGLLLAGVCYYRLRKKMKAASDVEYPAYGVTGPTKEREGSAPGDRKLAQSAQMYHYQHQKQQMIASERLNSDVNHRGSDAESEDENEEGDYTVFECPGLATNGDMEVRNPLFTEQTPVTAPSDVPGTHSKK